MSGWWLAALWAAAAAWLITRAVRGRRSLDTLHADAPVSSSLPMVTVIVPVRNEADVIASCLAGLLAQNYPADRLAIIVVNDGSTDASGDILAQIAAAVPRLKVISAGPLPPGWVGKSHACWRGARLAQGEFLCFIDADTVAAPGLLEAAVGEAQSKNLDLLSLAPRQSLGSLLERLVIPAGMFVLAFAGVTSAVGQFMLIRRTAYDAIGGHAAVRQAIAEDGAMADLLTRTSHRVALMNGAPFMTVRLYRRGRDLWEGLSKNVVETLGGWGRSLLICGLGLPLAWAALLVPLLTGDPWARALALAASLAVVALHIAGARYFRLPPWYGLLFPVGYTLACLLALTGFVKRLRGDVTWKGRHYPAD